MVFGLAGRGGAGKGGKEEVELFLTKRENKVYVALLDDRQRIVRPVYDYLQHLRITGCSINTLKTYGTALKLFWIFLEESGYEYREITPNMVGEFIEYLLKPDCPDQVGFLNAESRRTNKTVNSILGTVKGFYRYVSQTESGIENPMIMEEVTRPFDMYKGLLHHTRQTNKVKRSIFKLRESKNSIRILNEEEKKTILKNLPTTRDKVLFKLLRDSGMRIGEALSLQIEDIPQPKRIEEVATIHIRSRESNRADQQTKSGERPVIVPVDLLFQIDNYILEERSGIRTDHSYLFVAHHGRNCGTPLTYRAVWEVFNRVAKKTGIHFSFHDLRHTYCSEMIEQGVPLAVVKELAGHRNVATTQQYTHISNVFRDEAIKDFHRRRLPQPEGAE
jgi:integrase/recombinase XerD